MADLSTRVVLGYGRAPLMPVAPLLHLSVTETYRIIDTAGVTIGLLANVPDEVLRGAANTVSRIFDAASVGEVAFNASPDHSFVTSYTANIRVYGVSTVVATQNLGKPTPDGNGVIIVDLTATFAGLAAGDYTVSILATAPDGSADSAESAPFTLPL